jgi:serine phosphatase RsbU (regulator of sigma subunit)
MLGLETPSRGLWLADDTAHVLRLVPGSDPGTVDPRFETVPVDAALPVAEVFETGAPVFVHSLEERDRLYPTLAGAVMSGNSFAVLPLYAQQTVIGALALAFADERPFDDDEVRFVTAVAEQGGQALSRALLYDRERLGRDRAEADRLRIHDLNRALQTSLLPPSLPEIPGLEVSARYHPALAGLEVGGDFYDVFDTGGDWAVVVGDVCGKGPVAAAVTATARWTIRSVAMDMRQPAQVLRKLNEAMFHQQIDDRFCTLAYTRVVPTSQGVRLSVCRGGHPAPLVLRANGDIDEIGTPGSLIGVFPDVRLWEETTQLQAGDAYVVYTDGVTEARRNREQFGDRRLREALAGCVGLDADSIGERIESAVLNFGGPEPSDDLAILVLRVPA